MSDAPVRRPDDALARLDGPPGARALELALGSLRPSSAACYAGHWRRLAEHHGYTPADFVAIFLRLGPTDAAELLREYLAHMERIGRSARYRHTCVGAVFGMLRRWRAAGLTDLDLRDLVRAPKIRQGRGREDVPTPAEVEQLIACVAAAAEAGDWRPARDLALVLLLYTGGIRRGEAVGLRVSDYDRREQCVWVLSKGHDMREPQPIGDRALTALESLLELERRPAEWSLLASSPGIRRAMTGGDVYYAIGLWCDRAGLRRIAPHLLRHACGTQLAKGGASLTEVQRFLRHATPGQSVRYFGEDRARGVELARSLDLTPPG